MTSIETEKVYPSDGFIVYLKTPWEGIYNIGVTEKTPEEFLQAQNSLYHFRPPTPYIIVASKRIEDPQEMGKIFYGIIQKYSVFSHNDCLFYKISYEEFLSALKDMDFKSWIHICKEEENRKYRRTDFTPFRFRGKTYQRNYIGHTWSEYGNKWIGIYNYNTKILDTSALQPLQESESESGSD